MKRLILPWVAICVFVAHGAGCTRASTPMRAPETANPSSSVHAIAKPLTGSNSVELPTGTTSNTGAGRAQEVTAPTAPLPPIALDPLNDAQIVGVTQVAVASEDAEAKIAQAKATKADTKSFAATMIRNHEQAQRDLEKLGIPSADSPVREELQSDASSTMRKLRSATDDQFDRMYIDEQLDEQRKVLALIETRLEPDAKDAKLKVYLETIRSKIERTLRNVEYR